MYPTHTIDSSSPSSPLLGTPFYPPFWVVYSEKFQASCLNLALGPTDWLLHFCIKNGWKKHSPGWQEMAIHPVQTWVWVGLEQGQEWAWAGPSSHNRREAAGVGSDGRRSSLSSPRRVSPEPVPRGPTWKYEGHPWGRAQAAKKSSCAAFALLPDFRAKLSPNCNMCFI